jgi:hypothetical protein
MEGFTAIARIARSPELKASIHQMDVGPLPKRVVDNRLVLVDSN